MKSFLRKTAAALGEWQKYIITKHKTDNDTDEFPHPAAAPISTDQEAGGASTTPHGQRLYENNNNSKQKKSCS